MATGGRKDEARTAAGCSYLRVGVSTGAPLCDGGEVLLSPALYSGAVEAARYAAIRAGAPGC